MGTQTLKGEQTGPVPRDDQVEPQTNEVVLVYYIKIVGLRIAETIVEP